jgi:tripartite-type tricarboxylate transporter receptor subunit TctC
MGLVALMTVALAATEADDYPNRIIQIICPSAPGGGSDLLVRLIARELEPLAGQHVIVLNKTGAGGLIGTRALINANPDGYTLFVHAATAVVGNAYVVRDAGYEPNKDMVPVAPVSRIGWALVVNAQSPIKSVSDLVAYLKQKKGQATFASPNNASAAATAIFEKDAGVSAVRVNYRAVTEAIEDVSAGRIDFTFADIALAVAQAHGDRVRILAVTTPDRASVDDSYPTMIEAGVPGYQYISFFGLWAPTGTPQPVIDKLNGWMRKIGSNPEVQKTIVQDGFDPLSGSSEDLRKLVADDSERWQQLVKAGTIEVQ